jgi:hypothetical protein
MQQNNLLHFLLHVHIQVVENELFELGNAASGEYRSR